MLCGPITRSRREGRHLASESGGGRPEALSPDQNTTAYPPHPTQFRSDEMGADYVPASQMGLNTEVQFSLNKNHLSLHSNIWRQLK